MAIAFDAASAGATFSTAWAHTVGAGSNRALIVAAFDDAGPSNLLTAVAWNTSEALAKIAEVLTPGDRWLSLWWLGSPSTATANITLTTTASAMKGAALSLTGVGTLDVSGTGTASSSSPVSDTISVATNAWIVSAIKENSGTTVTWTNATEEAATVGGGLHMAHGGPLSGSQATSGAYGGGISASIVSASFTAFGGGPAAPTYPQLERGIRGLARGLSGGLARSFVRRDRIFLPQYALQAAA